MPLEEELRELIIVGFTVVMVVALLTTLVLWLKNRTNRAAYAWTYLHLVFFSLAMYFSVKAISFDYNHPMASEEISLLIGIAGVVWIFSMLCLIFGIFNFSKPSHQ